MIRIGQHYMPTGGNKGLVIITGESVDKKDWNFKAIWANGANKESNIIKHHLEQEIDSGRFKLIYDPPETIDRSVRNRLSEIQRE